MQDSPKACRWLWNKRGASPDAVRTLGSDEGIGEMTKGVGFKLCVVAVLVAPQLHLSTAHLRHGGESRARDLGPIG